MLKIDDLTFTYTGHKLPALESINLEVAPGKLVLVTGPSGSGKSTLLHCINGLAQIHYGGKLEGDIHVAGRDTSGKPLWQISELIGTVFQNPNTQFFQLTVADEITFGLEYAGFDNKTIKDRFRKALADVEIEHLRNRDLFTLSSGEKQKVALASIIAMDQPLLLMDEPTANLDIVSIHELIKVLQKLKNQGRTIIISEHRLWYLRELADQVVVIKDGKLIYDSEPDILNCSEFRDEIGLRIWNEPGEVTKSYVPQNNNSPILDITNLSGGVGKNKQIIKNVSLSLKAGNCIALMGHNGTGKTMLSRILTGLQKQHKGTVSIEGKILKPKHRIGKIGCVTQHAEQQLFSDTVLGELLLKPNINSIEGDCSEEILRQYDLIALKDRHPQTLSGGEKQRLAIAASMAMNPGIIILDEPTSGMDMLRMRNLSQQIKKLCDKGLAVIVITHDIELVSLCCDQILWIENGTIAKNIERQQYIKFFNELIKFNTQEGNENEIHGCLL